MRFRRARQVQVMCLAALMITTAASAQVHQSVRLNGDSAERVLNRNGDHNLGVPPGTPWQGTHAGAFSPEAIARAIQTTPPLANAPQSRSSEHRAARRALWTALGAVGGFFGGAYLGAAIEGDCGCDDPGFKGALIGMPVGALARGIAGFVLSR